MRAALRTVLVALLLGTPLCASAQVVRGVMTDAANQPVSGALAQLVDSANTIVARQLSAERGTFRLAAPRAGTYRLQTLRIGYAPTSSEPFLLDAGADVVRNVVLSNIRVVLDTLQVRERASCRVAKDVAASTLAVWEQVRTALTATQLSIGDSTRIATTVSFERRIDPNTGRVHAQSSTTATGQAQQPWVSMSVADLRRIGYMHSDSSGTTYDAPGLDVLLADSFLEDHCVRVVTAPRFGLAFEPTRDRSKVPEIKGTLWLDRGTLELRELEFRYANLPPENDSALGRMQFQRLSNGAWMISRWSIRMPVLEQKTTNVGIGRYHFMNMQVQVGDLVEQGGILSVYRSGTDTLWRHPPLTLTGVVRDSSGRIPAAGAYLTIAKPQRAAVADSSGRFTITDLVPGEYALEVQSALSDSIGSYRVRVPLLGFDSVDVRVPSAATLAALRPAPKAARFIGVVLADSSHRPLDGAVVSMDDAGLSTIADDKGAFELRDVPTGTHKVSVRKLGYRMLDTSLVFRPGATLSSNVRLSQIPTLDSVHVVERAVLPSFEEHRKAGFGHFLTRDDLAKVEGVSMSAIISTIPGAAVFRGIGTHSWAIANRGAKSIAGNELPILDVGDKAQGARAACYMSVYLDRTLVYAGRDREPLFDLATISPDRIEAIELYSGASQIPFEYQGLNRNCGVMVIWSRRTFKDDSPETKKDSSAATPKPASISTPATAPAPPPPRLARFSGRVVDSTRKVLAGVELSLADASARAVTAEDGSFDLRDIPSGTHRISARKLGYLPLDTILSFASGASLKRDIVLSRVTTLDSVKVVARSVFLRSFDEHQRMGFGHFLTRADLAKVEGVPMSSVLSGISGVAILRGAGSHAWIARGRLGRMSLYAHGQPEGLDDMDIALGAKPGCYSHVYVDRVLVYSGKNRQPLFDLASIAPEDIEGIEIYSGPAQTPPEYQGLNTNCGVVVIWTRRMFSDSAEPKKDSLATRPKPSSMLAPPPTATMTPTPEPPPPQLARFSGRVVDTTRKALIGVELSLSDATARAVSDENGSFDLRDIPTGAHRVSARKLGYLPLDTTLTFAAGASLRHDIVLSRVVTLDSMNVTARAVLLSFEENRRAGFGHFLDRSDLAKVEGATVGAVLSAIPGVRVLLGKATDIAQSSRGIKSLSGSGGTGSGCPMHVYLDRVPVYTGKRNEPLFNLRDLSPDRLEAVEVYAGASEIPVMYQGLNTNCGVLVLWTRRTFPDSAGTKP